MSDLSELLDGLEQAHARATEGPWQYDPSEGDTVWDADEQRPTIIALTRDPYGNCEADAALIVAAVNALPTLVAALRRAQVLADRWQYDPARSWNPAYGEDLRAALKGDLS